MPVHTLPLNERILDRSPGGARRWPKFTPEEAAELRAKGFPLLDLPPGRGRVQAEPAAAEDRVHGTLTIEQG